MGVEPGTGPGETGLHGADGDVQCRRDLLVGEALPCGQGQGVPFAPRQPTDGVDDLARVADGFGPELDGLGGRGT